MRGLFVFLNNVFYIKFFSFVWKDKFFFGFSIVFIKLLFLFRNLRIEVISINGIVGEGFDLRLVIIFGNFCLVMLENLYIMFFWYFVIKLNLF